MIARFQVISRVFHGCINCVSGVCSRMLLSKLHSATLRLFRVRQPFKLRKGFSFGGMNDIIIEIYFNVKIMVTKYQYDYAT